MIRFFVTVLAVIVLATFSAGDALAEDGSGDSSGGGKDNPLILVSSNPEDGQENVLLTTEIKLTFNKNVVNMSVRDNNMKCFSLTDNTGNTVQINVIMADDQMEPEKRREIVLQPASQLEAGTNYTLEISPELTSKSGVTLGQIVAVTFITAGEAAPSVKADSNIQDTEISANDLLETNMTSGFSEPADSKSSDSDAQAPSVDQEVLASDLVSDNQDKTEQEQTEPKKTENPVEVNSAIKDSVDSADKTNYAGVVLPLGGIALFIVAGYIYYRRKL
ncbi:Ig-like domain-containing protein [Phosphitispora sp. TUW77]|uniref:Ig-like domain-containing protein n=1 Tax=Phosphitispora sp. TUW77 TaxID=3152361 RepID=UPI003AB35CAD